MSITVNIKNPKDKSVTKLENVPYTTSVAKIKKIIAKIKNLDSDITPLKIIHKGSILNNEVTIGDVPLDGEQEITLFVAGIKKKDPVPEEEQPIPAPRGPSTDPLPNPDVNNRFQNPPNFANMNRNQMPQHPRFQQQRPQQRARHQNRINEFINEMSKPENLIKIFFGVILIGLGLVVIYKRMSLPSQQMKSQTTFLKFSRIFGLLIFIGVIVLIIFIQTRDVPWTKELLFESVKLFFKSMNPNWNPNVFGAHYAI